MATILETAQRVLARASAATPGPLIINRFDEPAGIITYQLQAESGGDVIGGISDDYCPRARTTANYVQHVYTAAPDLARFALLVDEATRQVLADNADVSNSPEAEYRACAVDLRRRLGLEVP